MAGDEGGCPGSSPVGGAGAGAAGAQGGVGGGGYDSKCIFCRISNGQEAGTELLPCEVIPTFYGGGEKNNPVLQSVTMIQYVFTQCVSPSSLNETHPKHEDLVCFRDIRPGAPHHYLIVPRNHMGNCKTLKSEHIPLVEKMMAAGKTVLQRNKFTDLNDIRMGFHWPPFCSIAHLHLHVLAPASQLGFLSRMVYRINSYWFITAEQLLERLKAESTTS